VFLSDNLYSLRRGTRARVTCTGHVHRKSLHRALGALGQIHQASINDQVMIINQSTHCINEQLYLNYLTVMSPVRRLKKLSSYYSIIWRNSTSSSDSDTSSSRRRLWQKSYLNRHRTILTRDSTRFHEIPREILPQSSKDDPDDKDDPNDKIPSQFLLCLSVKMTPPTSSSSTTIILNKLEDWEQWL